MDLHRDRPVESLRLLVPTGPPEVLKPEDLDIQDFKPEVRTNICQTCHILHERPVAFHEFISNSSSSSSEVEDLNETHELSVRGGDSGSDSDLDSMPELEDDVDVSTIEIPLWLIANGVLVTFRGGRMIFEGEQGPLWQEVLAQMLEEQESMAENN